MKKSRKWKGLFVPRKKERLRLSARRTERTWGDKRRKKRELVQEDFQLIGRKKKRYGLHWKKEKEPLLCLRRRGKREGRLLLAGQEYERIQYESGERAPSHVEHDSEKKKRRFPFSHGKGRRGVVP